MSKNIQQIKDEFLSHDINPAKDSSKIYSLEEEFVKSKNNRYFNFIILLSSFVVVVLLISVTSHILMRDKERNLEIEITEFEDLKMKELISSVGDKKSQLEEAKLALEELQREHQYKLSELDNEYQRLEKEIQIVVVSKQEQNKRIKQLSQDRKKQLAEIKEPYDKQYKEITDKIASLEQAIANNKQQFTGKNNWDFQNPEQRLYEIKLKKVRESYENKIKQLRQQHQEEKQALVLKYNPVFKEKKVNSIINKPAKISGTSKSNIIGDQEFLQKKQLFPKKTIAKMNSDIDKQYTLLASLQKIPYQNSPLRALVHLQSVTQQIHADYRELIDHIIHTYNPVYSDERLKKLMNLPAVDASKVQVLSAKNKDYLLKQEIKSKEDINLIIQLASSLTHQIKRIQKFPLYHSSKQLIDHMLELSLSLWKTYDDMMAKLIDNIKENKKELDSFNYFLANLTRTNAENGYILDARDNKQISVFIDPAHQIKHGDTGMVFRKDDQFIGTIRFVTRKGTVKAELVKLTGKETVQPLDKILLNKQESKK